MPFFVSFPMRKDAAPSAIPQGHSQLKLRVATVSQLFVSLQLLAFVHPLQRLNEYIYHVQPVALCATFAQPRPGPGPACCRSHTEQWAEDKNTTTTGKATDKHSHNLRTGWLFSAVQFKYVPECSQLLPPWTHKHERFLPSVQIVCAIVGDTGRHRGHKGTEIVSYCVTISLRSCTTPMLWEAIHSKLARSTKCRPRKWCTNHSRNLWQ